MSCEKDRHTGTKAHRHKGTQAQRHRGTEAQRKRQDQSDRVKEERVIPAKAGIQVMDSGYPLARIPE